LKALNQSIGGTHSERNLADQTMEMTEMGAYIQLGETRIWYDERGGGEPLVLMHGGLVDSRSFEQGEEPNAGHVR
jgi:hypothetical protein